MRDRDSVRRSCRGFMDWTLGDPVAR